MEREKQVVSKLVFYPTKGKDSKTPLLTLS